MSTVSAMRPPRRLFLFLGGLLVALLLTVLLALLSPVQTWVARRVLAAHPEWRGSLERISVAPGGVRVQGARWSRGSLEIRVPEVEAEVDLLGLLFSRAIDLRLLRARGLEVRLGDTPQSAPGAASADGPGGRPVADLLAGVLGRVRLPVDMAVDGIDVAGRFHLPGRKVPAVFSVRGGGFSAGREGRLELSAEWDSGDPRVGSFATKGEVRGRMEGPRAFSNVHLRLDSTARGEPYPKGASLAAEALLRRSAQGEDFRLALATPRHAVLEVTGELKPWADRLRGAWKLDLNSADLAPLVLGVTLPVFQARGAGGLEVDPEAKAPRVEGKLTLDLASLEVLRPELKALGRLALNADFEAGWRAGTVSVGRLSARLSGERPVLGVEVKQAFTLDPSRRAWSPSDPAAELARVRLEGVPTGWLAPWAGDLVIDGGDWTGEIVAVAAGGGLALRTAGEVSAGGLSIGRGGERWIHGVEVAVAGSASTLAGGWQGTVERLSVRAGAQEVAMLDARIGRLAGADQPLKVEGALRLNLAQVVRQPAAAGRLRIPGGEAAVKFGATIGSVRQFQADVRVENLRGAPEGGELPSLSVEMRAEVDAAGRVRFGAPVRMRAGERASDVLLAGEFTPRAGGSGGRVDARITGSSLQVADGEALGTLVSAPSAGGEASSPRPGAAAVPAPPWTNWEGRIEIELAEVVYGATVRARDVKGRLELDGGKVRMEGLRGSVGEHGRATLSGALAFDVGRPDPFAAEVQVEVREFDPGPWFRVASNGSPATLEGNFTVSSRLRGRAASLGGLANAVAGEVLLSSRGGVFRGLPVKVAAGTGGGGRVAGMIAAAGNALGSLTGRREPPAIAGRAQAVAEFAAGISTIPFDQLSLVMTRDAARNLALREFTLIAPELRLAGAGTVLRRGADGLLGDSLALEFSLRARGRQGDLLRHLGVLDPAVDELGYATCRLPLRVAGTPARPDCGELTARLTALVAEKSGVADKAGELLNRIIGTPK